MDTSTENLLASDYPLNSPPKSTQWSNLSNVVQGAWNSISSMIPPLSLRTRRFILYTSLIIAFLSIFLHPKPRTIVKAFTKPSNPNIYNLIPNSGSEFPRAIPESFCGSNWQKDYAEYHAAVLAIGTPQESRFSRVWSTNPFALRGSKPEAQRFLTFECPSGNVSVCGGMGDGIQGMTTAFLFALYTKRVFLIKFGTTVKPLEVFDAPFINWDFDVAIWRQRNGISDSRFKTLDWSTYDKTVEQILKFNLDETLKAEFEQNVAIDMIGNRGFAFWAYANGNYGQTLMNFGLYRHNIYACIMDYLVQPKPETVKDMMPLLNQIRDGGKFVIGVHLNVADKQIESTFPFLHCSRAIWLRYSFGRPLTLFVVTDSDVKDKLKAYFKDFEPEILVVKLQRESEKAFGSPKSELQFYQHFISSLWLFSETDYKIIPEDDTLGSIAMYRSYWRNGRSVVRLGKQAVNCSYDEAFVSIRNIAESWTFG